MHGDNIVARLMQATRSPTATIMMQRIVYWSRKDGAGQVEEGVRWVVNSREEWAQETGLTVKQVKTAMVSLRGLNLIQTRMAKWSGRIVHQVSITHRTDQILKGSVVPNGTDPWSHTGPAPSPPEDQPLVPFGTDPWSHLGPTLGPVWDQPYNSEEHSEEHSDEPSVLSHANPSGGSKKKGKAGGGKIMEEGKKAYSGKKKETPAPKSAASAVAAIQAVKATGHLHKPDSAAALKFLWSKMVSDQHKMFVSLSTKDVGQLGLFAKLCPPGKSEQVLTAVLGDWIGFVKLAEQDEGAFNTPAMPSVGFLLKHKQTALKLGLQPPQKIRVKTSPPLKPASLQTKDVQSIAQPKPVAAQEQKATLADILAED